MLDLEKIEQEHSDTCAEIELCCADDPPRGAIYRSFDALQEVIDEVRLLRSMNDGTAIAVTESSSINDSQGV